MTTIDKTDPRLTAFVLGELSADEAKEIQSAIDSDAELQQEVEAIRQTVAQIETVMREESEAHERGAYAPRRHNKESAGLHPPLIRRLLLPAAVTTIAASLVVAVLIAYQQQGGQIARLAETIIPMQMGIQTEDAESVSLDMDSRLRWSD